jgi:hypothetical protein
MTRNDTSHGEHVERLIGMSNVAHILGEMPSKERSSIMEDGTLQLERELGDE